MPPPPRAKAALMAMKTIGFSSKEAAPVLRKLLQVYDDNWEYIEEHNYQVLIDSILEEQESKAASGKKQDALAGDHPEHCGKRLRKPSENPSSSMLDSDGPGESSLKKPKVEADDSPGVHLSERTAKAVSALTDNRGREDLVSPLVDNRVSEEPASLAVDNRGKLTESILLPSSSERAGQYLSRINCRETRASARAHRISNDQANAEQASLLTYNNVKRPTFVRSKNLICLKEPKIEPGIEVQESTKATSPPRPKDNEADNDLPEVEVPIAMFCHSHHPIPFGKEARQYQQNKGDSSLTDISTLQANGAESLPAQNSPHNADKGKGKGSITSELLTSREATSIDIASSDTGEVKLMFSFNFVQPELCIPCIDTFLKKFEEKCPKSCKILQPDFSMLKIMKELCQFASEELTTKPKDDRQENIKK